VRQRKKQKKYTQVEFRMSLCQLWIGWLWTATFFAFLPFELEASEVELPSLLRKAAATDGILPLIWLTDAILESEVRIERLLKVLHRVRL
jgi:hypothetical protein